MKAQGKLSVLDKVGAVGAFFAAAAAPCCFPLLAAVGTVLGLGALQAWRGYMDYAIQGFVVLATVGNIFAFRQHRQIWTLGRGVTSAAAVLMSFYVSYQVELVYTGLGGLLVTAVWNFVAKHRAGACCRRPELRSKITCPHCGHQSSEIMPTDACVYFYECPKCHVMLRPKHGDCCVFCSYGSVKCPPIQSNPCCSNG